MKLLLANHSTYPRWGDDPARQKLLADLAERFSKDDNEADFEQLAREIIQEQIDLGVDLVTDGLVRWNDPISHCAGALGGGRPAGWARYFDADYYYRQPLLEKSARAGGATLADEYRKAQAVSKAPVKPVLVGPFTLGVLTRIPSESVRARRQLMEKYARALAREVEALQVLGASWIQIDEPAILRHPREMDWLKQLLAPAARRRGPSKIMLAVYFGGAAAAYPRLCRLPVDGLALDFTYDRAALLQAIARGGAPLPLALGVVDGKNTRLERVPDVLDLLEKLRRFLSAPENFIGPSCGLEFLPREKAAQKLARLKEIRDQFCARTAML